ncbi:hypothetical protein [Faecalimonas umbilicata]|uniref:hypothetical protein n=1 Tax=Faecalimonas umbilicata TaxID=1912855 RepID=UPI003996C80E
MMAPVEDMQIFSYGSCPEGNSTQVIAIGSNAEDPQRMADFIDWLYSPEGIELNGQANGAAGIKGLTWDVNEDGKPELTEFGKEALPMNDVAVDEEYGGGNWKDGVSALNFKTVNLEDIDPNTEHHITTRNGRQRLKIIRLHWMKTGVHTWVQIQRWNIWKITICC